MKNSLQAPAEGKIESPVRPFPTEALAGLNKPLQSSVKYSVRKNLV